NIDKGSYTAELFKEEFNLIFDNAQLYNIPDCEVYQDAVFLQKLFHVHWDQHFGPNAVAAADDDDNDNDREAAASNADDGDDGAGEEEAPTKRGKRAKSTGGATSGKGKRQSSGGSKRESKEKADAGVAGGRR